MTAENLRKKSSLTWNELIDVLLEIFSSNDINVDEVEEVFSRYASNKADWSKFAKFDKYKYTRNLVHEGNGKFNLMLLCWAEGNQSSIHDHSSAHCFVKVLQGDLREVKYFWPSDHIERDGSMREKETCIVKTNGVCYMNDQLGLHRIENPSHNQKAVSLHLYCPPFKSCQVFDERTGNKVCVPMTFWSKFGEKVGQLKPKHTSTPLPSEDGARASSKKGHS